MARMAPGLGAYRPLSSAIDSPMSRATHRFTQREITRAVRAVVAAGLPVAQVTVDKDGRIVIVPGDPNKSASPPSNSWDTL
jgi:hypothetical protein